MHAFFRARAPSAIDTSDAEAGPQLLIAENIGRIRCLNLRTGALTVVTGLLEKRLGGPSVDGPASSAQIGSPTAIAVASNGVVFVLSAVDAENGAVRRISAAARSADGKSAAERFVTTVVGAPRADPETTIYTASAAEAFRFSVRDSSSFCLIPSGAVAGDGKRDAVRLFVGTASDGGSIWRAVNTNALP